MRWTAAPLVAILALAGGLAALFHAGIDQTATAPALGVIALALFSVNAVGLAAASVTALLGMRAAVAAPHSAGPPSDRCAVLWLICGESPAPLARRAAALVAELATRPEGANTQVFILSDTTQPAARAAERAMFGAIPGVTYRNRDRPTGRKPGNLHDWLLHHGAGFDTMLVLDADSGFAAARLARLRHFMATSPRLGMVQTGIALRPGTTRLARLQRLSARLTGPVFTHGLARLSGACGNYWGHNALLRVAAFRQVAELPALPGRAPFGGPVLSHDFIEAAWMRAAGWDVRIMPDTTGSFEDAPTTTAAHTRRDRRWAQGNLQHLRLIGRRGLHPGSRLHLLAGIHSYLSAPIWLALVLLMGSGAVHAGPDAFLALSATLAVVVLPKLAGLARMRRQLVLRPAPVTSAFMAELALSTLIAPLWMLQRSSHVVAVLAGRDAGWRPAGAARTALGAQYARGNGAQLAGGAILLAVVVPQGLLASGASAALSGAMVLPVVVPLVLAPWLLAWLDRAPARADIPTTGGDTNSRRCPQSGGTGGASATHGASCTNRGTPPQPGATCINPANAPATRHASTQMCDLGRSGNRLVPDKDLPRPGLVHPPLCRTRGLVDGRPGHQPFFTTTRDDAAQPLAHLGRTPPALRLPVSAAPMRLRTDTGA